MAGLISGGGRLNLQLAALCPVVWASKIQRSSVVERSAVNRLVVGSNPTAGANFTMLKIPAQNSNKNDSMAVLQMAFRLLATRR
jgi:hypothetical protein